MSDGKWCHTIYPPATEPMYFIQWVRISYRGHWLSYKIPDRVMSKQYLAVDCDDSTSGRDSCCASLATRYQIPELTKR